MGLLFPSSFASGEGELLDNQIKLSQIVTWAVKDAAGGIRMENVKGDLFVLEDLSES